MFQNVCKCKEIYTEQVTRNHAVKICKQKQGLSPAWLEIIPPAYHVSFCISDQIGKWANSRIAGDTYDLLALWYGNTIQCIICLSCFCKMSLI